MDSLQFNKGFKFIYKPYMVELVKQAKKIGFVNNNQLSVQVEFKSSTVA